MKLLLIFSVVLLVAGCAATDDMEKDMADDMADDMPDAPLRSDDANQDISDASPKGEGMITYEELAMHSSRDDCWLLIDGKVYDVSGFMTHPGGDAIYQGCGMDATVLFETRPMGSGSPHSSNARQYLETFYIGDISP